MTHSEDNNELLIRYLLGELNEEAQERVEQRYIADPVFYEHLLTVEDDLIDAYADGELSQSRRTGFENHFLCSPERHARVEFARAWMAYVSRQSKAARPAPEPLRLRPLFSFLRFESWRVAIRVTAAVLVLLAGAWLIAEILRLRNRVEQAELQRVELEQQMAEERSRSHELSTQLEREREARDQQAPQQLTTEQTPPGIISLILAPGLVRGTGDAKRLIISPETRQVRLQVSFGQSDYESYRVVIRTVEGRSIWSKSGLKAQSKGPARIVVFHVPSGVFTTDDYILTLSGLSGDGLAQDLSEYSFSVSKK